MKRKKLAFSTLIITALLTLTVTAWKQGDAFDNIVLRDWYWTSTNVNIIKNSYDVSHGIFYLEVQS